MCAARPVLSLLLSRESLLVACDVTLCARVCAQRLRRLAAEAAVDARRDGHALALARELREVRPVVAAHLSLDDLVIVINTKMCGCEESLGLRAKEILTLILLIGQHSINVST